MGTTVGQPVTIKIDHREGLELAGELRAIPGVTVEQEAMVIGDFGIAPGVFVERKAPDDFGQSIIDRRLMTQVKAAKDAGVRLIFLVEGDPYRGKRRIHPNAITGAISYLVAIEGLEVVQCPRDQSPQMIATLARHLVHGLGYEINLREPAPKNPREEALYLLAGLPGIGRGKAIALLKHFGSVGAVMSASVEQLCKSDGIGAKVATGIRAALDARFDP